MKYIRTAITVILLLIILAPSSYASVEVYIDGRAVTFEEQAPIIEDGNTLVPLRKIFEELGAYVDWIKETRTVYAAKRFSYVMMTIDSSTYYVDGEEKELSVPPRIYNERTLVPIRAVSESLGCDVRWNEKSRQVIITSNQGEITVRDRYYNYSDTADDGTVLFTGRAAYPELVGEGKVIEAFNEYVFGDVQEAVVRARTDCYDSALLAYENSLETGNEFVPYMAEHTFDITYNKDKLLSMVCSDCNFAGWTHPNYIMYAMTYNMETGKAVTLNELINLSGADIYNKVYEEFKKLIEEEPERFYHDASAGLKEALTELKWYLAEDGVHFFMNPYEIAPYAAGVIETVVLPIQK